MSDKNKSSSATSPDSTKPEVQSLPAWGYGVIVALLLFFVIFGGVRSCNAKREARKAATASYAAAHPSAPTVAPVEALVLMHECFTPCSAFVGWSYKVRTDGDPIRIKYQGADWFDQPARGNFKAPKGFQPGEAQFASSDETNPHVKVCVYKKIIVQGGRP